jgi:hypothetical protein
VTDHDILYPAYSTERAHHDHRTVGFAGDLPGRAARHQAPGVFVAGGPGHDHVRVDLLGALDQHPCRMPTAYDRIYSEAGGVGLLNSVGL